MCFNHVLSFGLKVYCHPSAEGLVADGVYGVDPPSPYLCHTAIQSSRLVVLIGKGLYKLDLTESVFVHRLVKVLVYICKDNELSAK